MDGAELQPAVAGRVAQFTSGWSAPVCAGAPLLPHAAAPPGTRASASLSLAAAAPRRQLLVGESRHARAGGATACASDRRCFHRRERASVAPSERCERCWARRLRSVGCESSLYGFTTPTTRPAPHRRSSIVSKIKRGINKEHGIRGGTVNLDPLLVERVENECAREVSK